MYDEFYRGTWLAAGRAFTGGDSIGALRIGLDFFVGPGGFDQIPAAFKKVLLGNLREWEALTTSSDAFPHVSRDQIGRLTMPVLMLSGGKTYPMLRLTDAALERSLSDGRRHVVPNGTHDVCSEQPSVCATVIRAFLLKVQR